MRNRYIDKIGLIDVDGGKRITLDEALSKASPVLRRKMEHTRDVVLKAVKPMRFDWYIRAVGLALITNKD